MTQRPRPTIMPASDYKPMQSDNMPMPYGFGQFGKPEPRRDHKDFTAEQVRHIRRKEMLQREYAEYYDCSRSAISHIQRGDTYAEVK